ncbi:MAG: hypothetical protein WDA22_09925 [Bacteroidota bacterium]
MKNPTRQELMEFVDGTLTPQRFLEIEQLVSQSHRLQHEVALMQTLRKTLQYDTIVFPSKKFTMNVMNEIVPGKQESLWFRLAKNSSNVFAMILVLSLIGIALVSNPSGQKNEANLFSKSVELYSTAFNSVSETISHWTKQYTQPVGEIAKSSSGKFMLLGVMAFVIFIAVDELLGKKYFQARIKH